MFHRFTDEKLFTVAAPKNAQNDRLYIPTGTLKKQVSAARLLKTRSTFTKSVMVSVGVSSLGATELIFIDPGVKINGAYYHDVLLTAASTSHQSVIRRILYLPTRQRSCPSRI